MSNIDEISSNAKEKRTAVVIGSTGLIGGHLVDRLLQHSDYNKVISLVRKQRDITHPKLVQKVIDFDRPQEATESIQGDDFFCALGTTIKQAGSQDQFFRVDHNYPLQIARVAAQNKIRRCLLVSAMGANRNSSVFYNRVKGELEADISTLSFEVIHILRPSLLLGRKDNPRFGEKIAAAMMVPLGFAFVGPLAKYRAISGDQVAKAMIELALSSDRGTKIHLSDEIARI